MIPKYIEEIRARLAQLRIRKLHKVEGATYASDVERLLRYIDAQADEIHNLRCGRLVSYVSKEDSLDERVLE